MDGVMKLLPESCKKLLRAMSAKYGLSVDCIIADVLLGNYNDEEKVFEVSYPEKIGLV